MGQWVNQLKPSSDIFSDTSWTLKVSSIFLFSQAQWQKKSKFALPDEEEESILTHQGTALSYVDDFEDNLSGEDDEEGKERKKYKNINNTVSNNM